MAIVKSEEPPLPKDATTAGEHRTTEATFTLAHLSDPHLSSPAQASLGELLNKRISGYLSWRLRRRREHRPEVLDALLRDLASTNPDHTVITGDLTHLGLPSEFQKVERWLPSVGSPAEVTLIPGNHDAYVNADWHETFALWADYMASDPGKGRAGAERDFQNTFPILRVRCQTALIGISTAQPSPLFFASGSVGQAQLHKLDRILAETRREGLMRIVLIHHPPVPGVVSWRKRLTDAVELRSIIQRQGAELILYGHGHRAALTELATGEGSVMTIGVPSASALGQKPGRRARYHVYDLTRNDRGWDVLVSVRGYSSTEDRFVEEDTLRFTVSRKIG
jgi:3',5'-cyclic AMP phosphodiesterase CpdA